MVAGEVEEREGKRKGRKMGGGNRLGEGGLGVGISGVRGRWGWGWEEEEQEEAGQV